MLASDFKLMNRGNAVTASIPNKTITATSSTNVTPLSFNSLDL